MSKSWLLLSAWLISAYALAGTNPPPHDQVQMQKHLKVAKHAVAQTAVGAQKAADNKTAQSK